MFGQVIEGMETIRKMEAHGSRGGKPDVGIVVGGCKKVTFEAEMSE